MCAQTVTLLGVSRDPQCDPCKKKNEKLINECVGGTSSPSPAGPPVSPQPAAPPTPPPPSPPAGRPPAKTVEKNQIELLDKVVGGKPGKKDDSDLTGDWHTLYPTSKYRTYKLEEDIVVRFNRLGNIYTGQVVYSGSDMHPLGSVFCKVERIDNGRFYRGTYYYYRFKAVNQHNIEMEVYGTDTDFCRSSKSNTCGYVSIQYKPATAVYIYNKGFLVKHFSP
jgi:hypothetical protein